MESSDTNPERIDPHHATTALSATDLLALARGFSRMVWSIPIGLLLFTGTLDFVWSQYFRLPSYILAVALYFWGLTSLRHAQPMSPTWNRHIRLAYALALLLVYFAPFIYWWKRMPMTDHYVVNLFGMLLAVSWVAWLINRMAADVAAALHDRAFFIEARLSGWAVILFMGLPLTAYFAYATTYARRFDTPLYHVILDFRFIPHAPWLAALVLLPLALTFTVTWKTKERAFAALAAKAEGS